MSSSARAAEPTRDVVHAVMSLHKRGELRTGAGLPVTSRRQAIAIALAVKGKSTAIMAAPSEEVATGSGLIEAAAGGGAPQNSLAALAEINAALAAKVQTASTGQLALFHEVSAGAIDHAWQFLGQEQTPPHAALSRCSVCGSTQRTVRRFSRALVTYAAKGAELFSRVRPACAHAGGT